jgi:hypothetical protein
LPQVSCYGLQGIGPAPKMVSGGGPPGPTGIGPLHCPIRQAVTLRKKKGGPGGGGGRERWWREAREPPLRPGAGDQVQVNEVQLGGIAEGRSPSPVAQEAETVAEAGSSGETLLEPDASPTGVGGAEPGSVAKEADLLSADDRHARIGVVMGDDVPQANRIVRLGAGGSREKREGESQDGPRRVGRSMSWGEPPSLGPPWDPGLRFRQRPGLAQSSEPDSF